jgi:hypothetical protein
MLLRDLELVCPQWHLLIRRSGFLFSKFHLHDLGATQSFQKWQLARSGKTSLLDVTVRASFGLVDYKPCQVDQIMKRAEHLRIIASDIVDYDLRDFSPSLQKVTLRGCDKPMALLLPWGQLSCLSLDRCLKVNASILLQILASMSSTLSSFKFSFTGVLFDPGFRGLPSDVNHVRLDKLKCLFISTDLHGAWLVRHLAAPKLEDLKFDTDAKDIDSYFKIIGTIASWSSPLQCVTMTRWYTYNSSGQVVRYEGVELLESLLSSFPDTRSIHYCNDGIEAEILAEAWDSLPFSSEEHIKIVYVRGEGEEKSAARPALVGIRSKHMVEYYPRVEGFSAVRLYNAAYCAEHGLHRFDIYIRRYNTLCLFT